MTPTSTPLTVLIAARELSQSMALADMVASSRPGVRTMQFESSGEASGGIEIAMVVESPGPELGELSARVRAAQPQVPIVIITPRFDERAIELAAKIEATAIIASPCDPAALLRVLNDNERMLRFAGRCGPIETSELLRLHAAAQSNGLLHLAGPTGSGAIHLDDGQPVHAHTANHQGVDAVHEMLGWVDAKSTWIAGRSASTQTIEARLDSLIERPVEAGSAPELEDAPRDVLEKIDRLAQTPDILAAYLLRNSEIVTGRNDSGLDDAVIGRSLSRLSQVFHDMEAQQGDGAGSEIQATIGEHRLVVDRLGPSRLGFQIGVVVRQATPVCKSLRRLLRQIDRSFRKSLASSSRASSGAGVVNGAGLHRVA